MRHFRRLPIDLDRQNLPSSPDCHEVGRVLQAYLDGELGPDDAELVAEHLADCDRCEIESRTVLAVRDAIRQQRPDLDIDRLARLERFVEGLAEQP
jgi:hypothetical protein